MTDYEKTMYNMLLICLPWTQVSILQCNSLYIYSLVKIEGKMGKAKKLSGAGEGSIIIGWSFSRFISQPHSTGSISVVSDNNIWHWKQTR
jgi:hypothetical protein